MTAQAILFGGAGFIGTHLAVYLEQQGTFDRIILADVAEPPRADAVRRCIDVRQPIPRDLAEPAERTVLFNLAAVHRTPGHPTHEYYEANVLGAINVTEFAEAIGATEIVFTSSIAVYGPDEETKHEDTLPAPESAYGWSKLLAEEVHRAWQRRDPGHRLTIVRPAVIFGSGENGNFTRLAQALRRGSFVFPGRRDTIKACGYVGELVRSMDVVHGQGASYTLYNFCYDRPYTIADICEAFQRVGGVRGPRGTVPLPLMKLAASGFEFLSALGFKNSISRERIAKLVRSTNIEPGYLVRTGYVYETDLDEALRRWAAAEPKGEFV